MVKLKRVYDPVSRTSTYGMMPPARKQAASIGVSYQGSTTERVMIEFELTIPSGGYQRVIFVTRPDRPRILSGEPRRR